MINLIKEEEERKKKKFANSSQTLFHRGLETPVRKALAALTLNLQSRCKGKDI